MTDSSFFEPPEEDHGMGAASERSVTDSDQSMEAVLKYSDNPGIRFLFTSHVFHTLPFTSVLFRTPDPSL